MAIPSNEMILDRREAIKCVLEKANQGDIVVITGKGSEQEMESKDGAVPWDDRSVVREELTKLKNNK